MKMEFKFHHVFEKIEHCEKWRDPRVSLSKSKDGVYNPEGGEDTSKMSSPVKAWYMAQRQAILEGMTTASPSPSSAPNVPSSAPNVPAPNAPTPSSASISSNPGAFTG